MLFIYVIPPSYAVLSNVKNHTSMCNFPVLWLNRKSLKMCYLKAGWLVSGLLPGCSEAIWKTQIQLARGRSIIQAMTCMHTCCLKGTWHAAGFKPDRVHSSLHWFLVQSNYCWKPLQTDLTKIYSHDCCWRYLECLCPSVHIHEYRN